jgi:hypothetical protein
MDATDIEIAVSAYFGARKCLIVPNISWGMGLHECDLLVLKDCGWAVEVEIKVSVSDLKRDLGKAHGHKSPKIRNLFFAMPETMRAHSDSVPAAAGILLVGEGGYVEKTRAAADVSDYRFTDAERMNMGRLGTLRMWSLKRSLRDLRRDRDSLWQKLKDNGPLQSED